MCSSQGYALSKHCGHHRWQAASHNYYIADQHYAYQFSLHSIRCHASKVELIYASVPVALSHVPHLIQAQQDYQELSQSMGLNAHIISEKFKQPVTVTDAHGLKQKVSIPVRITFCRDTEPTLSSTMVPMSRNKPLFIELNQLFQDQ